MRVASGAKGRRVALVLALAVSVLVAPAMAREPVAARATEDPRPSGRIVVPRGQDIVAIDAGAGAEQVLFAARPTELILDVGLGADGRQVVFSRLTLARRDDPGGADLYRLPVGSAEPVLVAAHAQPGDIISGPLPVPGGTSVVYTYAPYGLAASGLDPAPRIERVDLGGGAPSLVVQEAETPAPMPDGTGLVFVRRTARGDALWLVNLDGSGAREILPPDRFLSLAYPRVSPDGTRIAVAATLEGSGLPIPLGPDVSGGAPRLGATRPALRLRPRWQPARPPAHGLPWDLWLVPVAGGEPQRLTYWYEDDPSLAWSPDGRWLAVQGGSGLRVLDVDSGYTLWLRREPAFGAIDWGRN